MFRDDSIAGEWSTLVRRLDGRAALARWAECEPALVGFNGVATLERALVRGGDPDRADAILGALVRIAAADGGCDDDALLLLLHLLSGVVLSLSRQLRDLAPDMLHTVANELACQIRAYPFQRRTRAWGANLRAETRRALLATYRPWCRLAPGTALGEHPLDPHSSAWETVSAGRAVAGPDDGGGLDVGDLLRWAVGNGVDPADLRLLLDTEMARAQRHAVGCDRRVAAGHGLALRTFYRRRERALAALRGVAATYLSTVA
jgi:hypothetical protein